VVAGLPFCAATLARTLGSERWLVRELDFNAEGNLGAWFQSTLLLTCAALIAGVALDAWRTNRALGRRWAILGLLFALLAGDEVAGLHEQLSGILRRRFEPTGLLYHAWVVPGMALVLATGAFVVPLLRSMGTRLRRLALAAAVLYVGGALGLEMLGGFLATRGLPWRSFANPAMVLEECLEFVGCVVFIHALAALLAARQARFGFLDDERPSR
jgi:hypothetical protein